MISLSVSFPSFAWLWEWLVPFQVFQPYDNNHWQIKLLKHNTNRCFHVSGRIFFPALARVMLWCFILSDLFHFFFLCLYIDEFSTSSGTSAIKGDVSNKTDATRSHLWIRQWILKSFWPNFILAMLKTRRDVTAENGVTPDLQQQNGKKCALCVFVVLV